MPDVILPALNEAEAVGWVVGRMPPGFRAIVVDNASTDGTADEARRAGATVVHEARQGFGAACWAGLQAATSDVVCFTDCDGSLDPFVLPAFVRYVDEDEADLVVGRRIARRGAWPVHARLANVALAALLRARTGLALADPGPIRVARRSALMELGLTDRRSGWPLEMILRAHLAGWRIHSLPADYLARSGRSKVTGTVRGTVRAVRDMSAVLRTVRQ